MSFTVTIAAADKTIYRGSFATEQEADEFVAGFRSTYGSASRILAGQDAPPATATIDRA